MAEFEADPIYNITEGPADVLEPRKMQKRLRTPLFGAQKLSLLALQSLIE